MNREIIVNEVHKVIDDAVDVLESIEIPVTPESVIKLLATQIVAMRDGVWSQENADKSVADWKRSNISQS